MSTATARRLVDWRAVGAGVLASLAVAVPAVVGVQVLDRLVDGGAGGWLVVVLGLVLVGLGLGGFVAARHDPPRSLVNGAAAAVCSYAVIQTVAIVRLLVADDEVTWMAVPMFALVAAAAGVVGSLVADSVATHR